MRTFTAALEDSQSLRESLDRILGHLAETEQADHVLLDLRKARSAADGLAQYLDDYAQRNAACHKVLAIQELVQHVLLYLSARDLLNAAKRKLFLGAAPEADLALLGALIKLPFLNNLQRQYTRQGAIAASRFHLLSFTLVLAQWKGFTPGHQDLSKLICQPPILAMSGTVICQCVNWTDHPRPESEQTSCDTGITLGMMVDVIHRLHKAHRMCALADPKYCDENGFALSIVRFEGELVLRTDDPEVLAMLRPKLIVDNKDCGQFRYRGRGASERMTRYAEAKALAHVEGRPMPALAEYEAEDPPRALLARPRGRVAGSSE